MIYGPNGKPARPVVSSPLVDYVHKEACAMMARDLETYKNLRSAALVKPNGEPLLPETHIGQTIKLRTPQRYRL